MRGATIACAVGIVWLAHACGGGQGGNSAPITNEEARPICMTYCEHFAGCGSGQSVGACAADCAATFDDWARKDAFETYFECLSALSCDATNSGDCLAMVTVLDAHRQWQDACIDKLAGCPDVDVIRDCSIDPNAGESAFVLMVTPSIVAEMTACMDEPDCSTRVSCVNDVLAKYGIDL